MFGNWVYIILLHCLFSGIALPVPVSADDNYEVFQNIQGLQGTLKCGPNPLGNLTAVYVTDCNKIPCHYRLKTKYHVYLELLFEKDHETLSASFVAKISGISIKAAQVNACELIEDGQKCPFKKDRKYLIALELSTNNLGNGFANLGNMLGIALIRDPVTKESFCAAIPGVVVKAID